MALIKCPECGKSISDKASKCPHCGIPSEYFCNVNTDAVNHDLSAIDYKGLSNVLISFDSDYVSLFSADHYISQREKQHLHDTYDNYYTSLKNKLIFQYVCNNASSFRIDIDALKLFLRRMHTLEENITTHNSDYIEKTLVQEKEYFDNILTDIDPNICRDTDCSLRKTRRRSPTFPFQRRNALSQSR